MGCARREGADNDRGGNWLMSVVGGVVVVGKILLDTLGTRTVSFGFISG
jgi:hypothetical protein